MTEFITNKNYSEAERALHVVDKLMLDLIADMGGTVVGSGVWTCSWVRPVRTRARLGWPLLFAQRVYQITRNNSH
jgi:hypothetical protein